MRITLKDISTETGIPLSTLYGRIQRGYLKGYEEEGVIVLDTEEIQNMSMRKSDGWLNASQLADALKISRQAVSMWRHKMRHRYEGKLLYLSASDVNRYLAERDKR